jgi:hypothetical protein
MKKLIISVVEDQPYVKHVGPRLLFFKFEIYALIQSFNFK